MIANYTNQEAVHNIHYSHMLMLLIAVTWILEALLLAGCTSSQSTIANVYLLSIKYSQPSQASTPSTSLFDTAAQGGQIVVRSSYFGLCAKNIQHGQWVCGSKSHLALSLGGASVDPLNVIGMATHFKDDVIFPGLILGAMALKVLAFIGFATFPGWVTEIDATTGSDIDIKPFPSRRTSHVCLFVLLMACLFLIASAVWQHVAAASATSILSSTTQQYLKGTAGAAAMALVWISLALTVVTSIGLVVMILSIQLLDRLTGDD